MEEVQPPRDIQRHLQHEWRPVTRSCCTAHVVLTTHTDQVTSGMRLYYRGKKDPAAAAPLACAPRRSQAYSSPSFFHSARLKSPPSISSMTYSQGVESTKASPTTGTMSMPASPQKCMHRMIVSLRVQYAQLGAGFDHQHGGRLVEAEAVELHDVPVEADALQDADLLALRPHVRRVSHTSRGSAPPDKASDAARSWHSWGAVNECGVLAHQRREQHVIRKAGELLDGDLVVAPPQSLVHLQPGEEFVPSQRCIHHAMPLVARTQPIHVWLQTLVWFPRPVSHRLTRPKLPLPRIHALPSGWWQISTSFGEMAMLPADDFVLLLLTVRTEAGGKPLLPSVFTPLLW